MNFSSEILVMNLQSLHFNETQSNDSVCVQCGPKRDSLSVVIPVTILYGAIFFVGLIGNISTCITIARNKSLHTSTNYYLFSLSISDLLLLLSGLPQEIYMIWSRYPYIFGYTFCIARGLFSETSTNATVLTIVTFTIERYLAICHPFFSYTSTMTKLSRALKQIIIIWIVAIGLAIPQALQFGLRYLNPHNSNTLMCQLVHQIFAYSFEVSTCVFFIFPLTIISILYVLIGIKVKKSHKLKTNLETAPSTKVVKMLVTVVVAFFVCWAPFHIQRLVAIYGSTTDPKTHLYIYEIATYISGISYYLSTCINPFLYNIMSKKFRKAFQDTFENCCFYSSFQLLREKTSYNTISQIPRRNTLNEMERFSLRTEVSHMHNGSALRENESK